MNALLSHFPGRVAGAAVGAVVAGLVLSDSEAHALIVNVGGQDYEVSTFTGSYNDNISKFETAANGGVMPWWGSETDAAAFASAVGTNLGLPNGGVPGILVGSGPYFAYVELSQFGSPGGSLIRSQSFNLSTSSVKDDTVSGLGRHSWAQATLVPAASSANVPGPLPAVGLAVAFGFSRKLRKRIKASASNPPSASAEA